MEALKFELAAIFGIKFENYTRRFIAMACTTKCRECPGSRFGIVKRWSKRTQMLASGKIHGSLARRFSVDLCRRPRHLGGNAGMPQSGIESMHPITAS